jgi:hypothetical protein
MPAFAAYHLVRGGGGSSLEDGSSIRPGDATAPFRLPRALLEPTGRRFRRAAALVRDLGRAWYVALHAPLVATCAWLDDHRATSAGCWSAASGSSKRFDSRKNPELAVRPTLALEYERGLASLCDALGLDDPTRALCTTWCEALDCDADVPLGSAGALLPRIELARGELGAGFAAG